MKMVDRKILYLVLLKSIVTFICAQTTTTCPGGAALLGSDYTVVGDRSKYAGFIWVRPNDGRYVVTCNPSCSPVAGYSASINDTHSTLTIDSVRIIDAGTWSVSDANVTDPVPVYVCQLTAAEVPRCRISSDEDTDSLEPGTQLTLTVDITGYYCSLETGFDLTTGDVTEELGRHNVTVVSNITVTTNFTVDITRLGDVTLDFICDRRWTLTCGGVQKLLKTPPHCNISSDTDTTALHPGTNLTLTVNLRNYYCSQAAGYNLTTGSITETLLQNQTMANITDTVLNQSFNVTSGHFGDVTVTFMCDGNTRPLVCDGVDKLSGVTSSTAGTVSTPPTTETSTVTVPGVTTPTVESSTIPPDVSTPISPTAINNENPPSDATTIGLAVGLSLLAILLITIGVMIYRYRQQIGNYFVTRKKDETQSQNSNFNRME